MRSLPWWRIATLAILLLALIISVSAGRTIDAVVIGILMIPTMVLVGLWIYGSMKGDATEPKDSPARRR